jgi:hypothetical protein
MMKFTPAADPDAYVARLSGWPSADAIGKTRLPRGEVGRALTARYVGRGAATMIAAPKRHTAAPTRS